MRKRILITLAAVAALVVVTCAVVGVWYARGGLDQKAREYIADGFADMNIRAEVGPVHLALWGGTVRIDGLILYPNDDPRPFLSVERASAGFAITDLLAQKVELHAVEVINPVVSIRFDESGRSNLDGIKWPERPERETTTDQVGWQSGVFTIVGGSIDYADVPHKLDGSVRNLRVGLTPSETPATPPAHRLTLGFTESSLQYDGRELDGITADLGATLSRDGATIEKLSIDAPGGTTSVTGTVTNWKDPQYTLQVASTVSVDRIGAVVDPSAGLTGTAMLEGTVTGHGAEYAFDGELTGDDLYVAGVRVARVSATGKLQGDRLDYAWQGALIASRLTASGFDVSNVRYDGRVAGSGDAPSLEGKLAVGSFNGRGVNGAGLSFAGTANVLDRSANGELSLTSLTVRTVRVGSIRAKVSASGDTVDVPSFTAALYDGSVAGSAKVQLAGGTSSIDATFRGVDVDKSMASASPDAPRVTGRADGAIKLSWPGVRIQDATGSVIAKVHGGIPSEDGEHPLDGELALTAVPGRLKIERAEFTSGNSRITATGEFGWDRKADVNVTADAADGSDLVALVTAANPAAGEMLAQRNVAIAGAFHFDGRITGAITNPSIDGHMSIGRVEVNGEELGSFSAALARGTAGFELRDAKVARADGASIAFELSLPSQPGAGQVVDATITSYPIVSLFNLSPIGASEDLKAFGGKVSGHAKLTIPGDSKIVDGLRGSLDLDVDGASLRGQPLDRLSVRLAFGDRLIEMRSFELATPRGRITGRGEYEKASKNYRAVVDATAIDLKLVESMMATADKPAPITVAGSVTGHVEFAGLNEDEGTILTNVTGRFDGKDVTIQREAIGAPVLTIATAPDAKGAPVATVTVAADVRGHRRELSGQVFIAEEDQPFKVALALDGFDALSLAGAPPEGVTTRVTGNVAVEGYLGDLTADNGIRERLKVDGRFTELSVVADVGSSGRQYRFANRGDLVFGVADNALRFDKASFFGDGTEVTIAGDLALASPAVSNLTVAGDLNLELITSLVRDVYTTGSANLQATVSGPPGDPRFSGFADLKDIGVRVVDVPIGITNGNGRVVFTSNQALIESLTAQANGGKVIVDGGVLFAGLKPSRWRFGIDAKQVRVTYPEDVRSIVDGDLVLQGNRQLQVLSGTVNLRHTEFTRDIELNDLLSLDSDRPRTIGGGASAARSLIRLDLNVEARDSIIVRNNLADLAASASLVLTGPIEDPVIDGRATITRGTLDFRDNEYQINRGVVRFPGRLGGDITFDIQAESDIRGYRVTVGIAGTPDKTYPVLRSEPALTEPQIVSLILTGDIGTAEAATENLGQQGVNLASALLTEALSRSVEKRTGELFGINRFQIDPLVGGRNTSARLTLGRQVNRNLSILYSTNLSSGEDQVIQLEYKLTNKFSLVASRDENGAYGLDIRVRKRF